jgi:hypothetical protein
MTMDLYAEREGNVQCAHTTFDAAHGLKISIRAVDGETIIEIDGVSDSLTVCDGLSLTIKVYEPPNGQAEAPPQAVGSSALLGKR